MSGAEIVVERIVLMTLVLAVGFLLRRRRFLDDVTVERLSRLVVDVVFPAHILAELTRSVSRETIAVDGVAMGFGVAVVALALIVGVVLRRWCYRARGGATFAFLVGTPNWIFLPLLIAEGLFGHTGVRVVLMMNAGALMVLWTFGVGVLCRDDGASRERVKWWLSPGLLATAVGLAIALVSADANGSGGGSSTGVLWEALSLLGSCTVPLALLVTGAQLGGLANRALRPTRPIGLVCLGRLIVAPLVAVAVLESLQHVAGPIDPTVSAVAVLVATMPVALSASLFTQRFDGDLELAAASVFWSTMGSLATVPCFAYAGFFSGV